MNEKMGQSVRPASPKPVPFEGA